MAILWSVLSVLAAIMILVFIHEMGHFLAAKLFGMRVDKFSVGFPPKILGKKIGKTEYVLGATPLGGYVKIAGMIDESMDTEFVESEPQPWEFRSKPVWQRMVVICAGVTFNIILALGIFAALRLVDGNLLPMSHEDGSVFVADSSVAAIQIGLQTGDRILSISGTEFNPAPEGYGSSMVALLADSLTFEVDRAGQRLILQGPDDIVTQVQEAEDGGLFGLGLYSEPSVVGMVMPGSPAADAGLMEGDRIQAIGGREVDFWRELTHHIRASEGSATTLHWLRRGEEAQTSHRMQASIVPRLDDDGVYRIGIGLPVRRETYSAPQAMRAGVMDTWNSTVAIVIHLKRIVTGRENLRKSLGGPVMVAKVTGEAAQRGWTAFWRIVAVLSVTLAVVNILPIPALDGGHLVFLVYEAIFRRTPSLKVRMVTQQIGFALLLALMAFLIYNDIMRL